MGGHPIENIMQTTMESIRNMVDVNTIVGDTVVMGDGTVIIPISKVSFGFVAGGGEYGPGSDGNQSREKKQTEEQDKGGDYPFAGGAGAGVCISPMAFLVVSQGEVNLLPVQFNSSYERLMSRVPDLICQMKDLFTAKAGGGKDRQESGEKAEKSGGGSWFKRNKRNIYDEDDAVDENYRASKDEL